MLSPDDTWIALAARAVPFTDVIHWAAAPECGAIGVFLGMVRSDDLGDSDGDHVAQIEFEAFERGFIQQTRRIIAAARTRWPDLGRIAVVHRVGTVAASEPCVTVVVAAPHRSDATMAKKFGIDVLKRSVPVWKTEQTARGLRQPVSGSPITDVSIAAREWDGDHLRPDPAAIHHRIRLQEADNGDDPSLLHAT